MGKYKIGKDLQRLRHRVEALEARIGQAPCECAHEPVLRRVTHENKRGEGERADTIESKSWSFAVDRTGKCELREGGTLTLFSDGRFRAIGSRKCNAGGIISCKDHKICVMFSRGGDAQCVGAIEIGRYTVVDGLIGPGSEFDFTFDGSDAVLRDLYSQIHCASMWVCHCETGI